MRLRNRRLALALAYASIGLVSCDSPLGPDDDGVARLEATPPALLMVAGETRNVTIRVLAQDGRSLADRRPYFSTQDPTKATVSQTGIVTAVATGNTSIAASAGGKSVVVPVSVSARPVTQVRLVPATTSVQVGATATLRADPVDATGSLVPGRPVIWSSSANAIATVTSQGVVTGIAAGTATITAAVDGVNGTAAVTVTPIPVASVTVTPNTGSIVVGANIQLSAATASATGQTLNGRLVSWTSSANAIATVSSTGFVTGIGAGTATITALSEGVSSTARITVSPVPVASIRVTPSDVTVAAGQSSQLTAQPLDAGGNVLNQSVTWSSEAASIATVSNNGRVTGVSAGTVRVNARIGGVTGTANVTVSAVPIARIEVTPSSASISIGNTQQLTATPRDAAGNALPGRSITWLTGAPSIATVSQTGLVTGIAGGTALVFAASEGQSGSASVTVAGIPVASVTVTPGAGTIQQGQALQLGATARDAQGNVLSGRPVTWTSTDETIATVSSTGRVIGIAAGSVTIRATVEGTTGSGTYTVTPVPVGSVLVAPANLTLSIGGTQTLTLTLLDGSGNPLSTAGRVVAWSTSNAAVATVSNTGVVSGVASGSATITVTSEGRTGTANVTVSQIPVASVTLAPNSVSLDVGATQAVTATARDASNNVLTGRPVTWSSTNPAVATVNTGTTGTSNTITAVATGSATISAVVGGVTGITTVTVTQVPVATISVTGPASVVEGASITLTATTLSSGGQILTGRTVVWSSNNPQISVSQTGVVTAVLNSAAQTATITASNPGGGAGGSTPSGSSSVGVTFAPVGSVSSTPSASVSVGNTVGLSAALATGGGQFLSTTGRTLTWTSLDVGVATVNASGVVTAVSPGQARVTVTAASPGQGAPFPEDTTLVTVNNIAVASVVVAPRAGPNPGSVRVGGAYARRFVATPRDAQGNALTNRSVVWTSSDPTNVIVTQQGDSTTATAQAIGGGSVTLSATSEGITGSITVAIDLVPVATVAVAPPTASLNVFSNPNVTLAATPQDSGGTAISGAALGGRTTTWGTSNGAVATVSNAGVVTAAGGGSATIMATVANPGGGSGTSTITVAAPVASVTVSAPADSVIGTGTVQLSATLRDSGNNTLSGRPVTWSAGTAFATVNASGLVTGVSPGNATFTATSEGQTSAAFTVRGLAAVATVVAAAPDSSIEVGETVQGSATLRDGSTNVLTGRPVAWNSSNPAKATVNASGLITAVDSGTTTITATSEGRNGSFTLTVALVPASSVTVTPSNPADSTGRTVNFTATPRDASNNPLAGRAITWSSSAPSKATINPSTGVATMVDSGSVTITATTTPGTGGGGTASGTSTITIVLTPVNTVSMPATANVTAPGSTNLVATVTDTRGGVAAGRSCPTISSSNPAVATVGASSGTTNGSGQLTVVVSGLVPGTTTITVTCDGKSGTTTVSVS